MHIVRAALISISSLRAGLQLLRVEGVGRAGGAQVAAALVDQPPAAVFGDAITTPAAELEEGNIKVGASLVVANSNLFIYIKN